MKRDGLNKIKENIFQNIKISSLIGLKWAIKISKYIMFDAYLKKFLKSNIHSPHINVFLGRTGHCLYSYSLGMDWYSTMLHLNFFYILQCKESDLQIWSGIDILYVCSGKMQNLNIWTFRVKNYIKYFFHKVDAFSTISNLLVFP